MEKSNNFSNYINNDKKRKRNQINLKFDNIFNKIFLKDKIQNSFFLKKLSNSSFRKQLNISKFKKINLNNKTIKVNLSKYNITRKQFHNYIINGLIFDGKSREISVFKDLLFWNDEIECLKRFYSIKESKIKIKKFIKFYNQIYNILNIYPIFFHIGDCKDVMIRNYRRKYRYQNEIRNEKKKEKKKYKKKNKENNIIIFQKSLLENSNLNKYEYHQKKISQSFNISTFSPDEILLNYNNNINNNNKLDNKQILTTRVFQTRNHNYLFSNSYDSTIKSLIRNLSNKLTKKFNIQKFDKSVKLRIKNAEYLKKMIVKNRKNRNFNLNNNNQEKIINILNNKKTINSYFSTKISLSSNNSFKKLPNLKTESNNNYNKIKNLKNKNEYSLTDRYLKSKSRSKNKEKKNGFSLKKEEKFKAKIIYNSSRVSPIRIYKNLLKVFPQKKTINRLDIKKLNII